MKCEEPGGISRMWVERISLRHAFVERRQRPEPRQQRQANREDTERPFPVAKPEPEFDQRIAKGEDDYAGRGQEQ